MCHADAVAHFLNIKKMPNFMLKSIVDGILAKHNKSF